MVNKVLLAGRVTKAGPKLSYTPGGHPQCSFTVVVEESREGQTYRLFAPIEVLSSHAEYLAEHLNAGDLVVVDGTLRWKSWIDKKRREARPAQRHGVAGELGEPHGRRSVIELAGGLMLHYYRTVHQA